MILDGSMKEVRRKIEILKLLGYWKMKQTQSSELMLANDIVLDNQLIRMCGKYPMKGL